MFSFGFKFRFGSLCKIGSSSLSKCPLYGFIRNGIFLALGIIGIIHLTLNLILQIIWSCTSLKLFIKFSGKKLTGLTTRPHSALQVQQESRCFVRIELSIANNINNPIYFVLVLTEFLDLDWEPCNNFVRTAGYPYPKGRFRLLVWPPLWEWFPADVI